MPNSKPENSSAVIEQAGLRIEIVAPCAADLLPCLQLYASLKEPHLSSHDLQQWIRLFGNNPFGPGLLALAACAGELVGCYALIPSVMRIAGHDVLGAKGEFLAVVPSRRLTIDPTNDQPLPISLVLRLNAAASEAGIQAVFGVASGAASICHVMAGERRIKSNMCQMVLPLSADLGSSSELAASKGFVRSIDRFQEPDSCLELHSNYFFLPNCQHLNYRFANDLHASFAVEPRKGSDLYYFVLSTALENGLAKLRYFSTLDLPPQDLRKVVVALGSHAKSLGATGLSLVVSASDSSSTRRLAELGFQEQPFIRTVFATSDTFSIDCNPSAWCWNEAYAGYYQR